MVMHVIRLFSHHDVVMLMKRIFVIATTISSPSMTDTLKVYKYTLVNWTYKISRSKKVHQMMTGKLMKPSVTRNSLV